LEISTSAQVVSPKGLLGLEKRPLVLEGDLSRGCRGGEWVDSGVVAVSVVAILVVVLGRGGGGGECVIIIIAPVLMLRRHLPTPVLELVSATVLSCRRAILNDNIAKCPRSSAFLSERHQVAHNCRILDLCQRRSQNSGLHGR
jgi:hypothetical protein